jgi:hypothetical protein
MHLEHDCRSDIAVYGTEGISFVGGADKDEVTHYTICMRKHLARCNWQGDPHTKLFPSTTVLPDLFSQALTLLGCDGVAVQRLL